MIYKNGKLQISTPAGWVEVAAKPIPEHSVLPTTEIQDVNIQPVYWRKIDHGRGLKSGDIVFDGKYSHQVANLSLDEMIKANFTHYLTQSDLLKLKFED